MRRSEGLAATIARLENAAWAINNLIAIGLLTEEEARPAKFRLAALARESGLVFDRDYFTPTLVQIGGSESA